MEESIPGAAMEEFIPGAAMEESIPGAAVEESLAGADTKEPLESADAEGVNTGEEALAGASTGETVATEEATALDTNEPLVGADAEGVAMGEEALVGAFTGETVAKEDESAVEELGAKKLLVLDVNGLLVATYHKAQKTPAGQHHVKLGNFYVYKRPGCEEFLNFCFKHFVVGVWSSAREHNVSLLVNYIFKDLKPAFMWHQRHCSKTAVMHPDNKNKPIFLKELVKLWAEFNPGRFDQSNTLLIDDSPYKALKNPPHTAIFPKTYNGDEVDDDFLNVLRTYLEGLHDTTNVQEYVSSNPIGEPGFSSESPSWSYFSSIVNEGPSMVHDEVVNGVIPAAQVQEHVSELNPEEIELEDMDQPRYRPDAAQDMDQPRYRPDAAQDIEQPRRRPDAAQEMEQPRHRPDAAQEMEQPRYRPHAAQEMEQTRYRPHAAQEMDQQARRRDLSPAGVSAHSSRNIYQALQGTVLEPKDGTGAEIHWRRNARNRHESETVSRRNFERERERSPHIRMYHFEDKRRFTPNHATGEFFPQPSSDYVRDPKPRGNTWHDRSVVRDPSFSRDSYARRSNEHQDMGRPLPSRQFMTSGNIRDWPPPPVLTAHDLDPLPSAAIPPRSRDNAEQFDSYGGRRLVTNVALTAPTESWVKRVVPRQEHDRRWEEPVNSSLERGYDRGFGRPTGSGRASNYDRRWEEPASSSLERGYDRGLGRPMSSRSASEYDRRWEEPVTSGRGHEYNRRWGEPVAPARDRWKDPVGSARGNDYDSRWKEPASRERRYDSGWDLPASSSHGMEYDSRWEPESTVSNGRRREYVSRWDENVHSDHRKDYDRRWEQPREYESKWSRKGPPNSYASPPLPPEVDYSYRNSSVEYKGRYNPPADRNMVVGPRDDHRPYHWGASNNYRR